MPSVTRAELRYETSRQISRRRFFNMVGWFGAILSALLFLVSSLRFFFPNVLYEAPRVFKIGGPQDYPDGSRTMLEETKLFVLHDQTGYWIISAVCTHLGCTVAPKEFGFACPCHGSVYDRDGNVTGGPAPKALAWYPLSQAGDGRLVVDQSKEMDHSYRFQPRA